jgi:hypothetical protein
MQKLFPKFYIGLNNKKFIYETCIKPKCHRSTYLTSDNKKGDLFYLVYTDIWGPSPILSWGLFIEDKS